MVSKGNEARMGPEPRSPPDSHVESRANYCSALATLLNVPFTLVPVSCTAAMIATEIPAAMRPYSMAVAPELSFKKRRTSLLICDLRCYCLSVRYARKNLTRANLSGDLTYCVNFYLKKATPTNPGTAYELNKTGRQSAGTA